MDGVRGIYHVGDAQPMSLQEFLNTDCDRWALPRPWRMPLWMIQTAASLCELWATLFHTKSPLTRDFVTIGTVSYCGDTTRMRQELLAELKYPTLRDGRHTL